jgi:hypothetical protein
LRVGQLLSNPPWQNYWSMKNHETKNRKSEINQQNTIRRKTAGAIADRHRALLEGTACGFDIIDQASTHQRSLDRFISQLGREMKKADGNKLPWVKSLQLLAEKQRDAHARIVATTSKLLRNLGKALK